ncbi:MAG: MBOAT family protein [Faecalibacterium sp.]|nr:MBOAT family protein [Faecalibacterium sp.]
MLFNSVQFLIFFPAVTLLYFVIPYRVRYLWLLAASYYFYMCWNPRYALLMAGSTLVTWLSGLLIDWAGRAAPEGRAQQYKKLFVAISCVLNLGVLFLFKYANFAIANLQRLLAAAGLAVQLPGFDVLLPVGISFYTFQALSYTLDVYRGEVEVEKNPLRYALFVSFFPQLVAGPIERSKNLLGQLYENHTFDLQRAKSGLLLMLWGYFEKVVIADRAAVVVSEVFDHYAAYGGVACVLAVVLFAVQVYCDFAGYSDIAVGAAQVMGFRLMQNFRQPYFARSMADFWSRWHISLSTWLGDYVFEPLVWSGWTRKLPLIGHYVTKPPVYSSLIITFLISGLWHGASWNYVLWGLFHGVTQVIGKMSKPLRRRWIKKLHIKAKSPAWMLWQQLLVFGMVCISYVFFRADTIGAALGYFGSMFGSFDPWILFDGTLYHMGLTRVQWQVLLVSIAILWLVDLKRGSTDLRGFVQKQPAVIRWAVYIGAVLIVVVFGHYGPQFDAAKFIYFQF